MLENSRIQQVRCSVLKLKPQKVAQLAAGIRAIAAKDEPTRQMRSRRKGHI
jgi:hypothetical protein